MINIIFEKDKPHFNIKTNDIMLKYFKNDPITKTYYMDILETKSFINQHINNNQMIICFYDQVISTDFIPNIVDYIESFDIVKCKVFVFTFDFWHQSYKKLYNARHCYAFTFAYDIDQLNSIHCCTFTSKRLIFNNLWSVYENSIVPFNPNPVKKILLSGLICKKYYPERWSIYNRKYQEVDVRPHSYSNPDLDNNDKTYAMALNGYLACFCSSVHIRIGNMPGRSNCHAILLKVFEILASGSLLIVPETEIIYLKKLGLLVNVHYISADLSAFKKTINFVLSDKNRANIDNIRQCGQKYAIDNLNSELKYLEIKNILLNTISDN